MPTSDAFDRVQKILRVLENSGFAIDVEFRDGRVIIEAECDEDDVDPTGVGGGGLKGGGGGS